METLDFDPLAFLLQASSKDVVTKLCNDAFLYRNDEKPPNNVLTSTAKALKIDDRQTLELFTSLRTLIKNALFCSPCDSGELCQLFPGNFHKNLRDLLVKIILERITEWRSQVLSSLVSLPKLVDFDWRMDIKSASSSMSSMSVPTCLLQLQVQDNTPSPSQLQQISNVCMELSKETLDTMLDGLGRIRDQLSSVATKS